MIGVGPFFIFVLFHLPFLLTAETAKTAEKKNVFYLRKLCELGNPSGKT